MGKFIKTTKNSFYLLLLLFCLCALGLYILNPHKFQTSFNYFHTHQEKTYYENGKLSKNSTKLGNNLHGISKYYYPNGKKKYEVSYFDGVCTGIIKIYNFDGKFVENKFCNDRMVSEKIKVHKNPDLNSPVIAELKQNERVGLLASYFDYKNNIYKNKIIFSIGKNKYQKGFYISKDDAHMIFYDLWGVGIDPTISPSSGSKKVFLSKYGYEMKYPYYFYLEADCEPYKSLNECVNKGAIAISITNFYPDHSQLIWEGIKENNIKMEVLIDSKKYPNYTKWINSLPKIKSIQDIQTQSGIGKEIHHISRDLESDSDVESKSILLITKKHNVLFSFYTAGEKETNVVREMVKSFKFKE